MNQEMYQKNDQVFDPRFDWGIVLLIKNSRFEERPVVVEFANGYKHNYTLEGRSHPKHLNPILSFTNYMEDQGFTQVRPRAVIKKGTPVFVRNTDKTWHYKLFSHFGKNNEKPYAFADGLDSNAICWDEISLTPPEI